MIFELNLANLFLIGAAWLVNRLFPGPNSRADTPADPGTEQRSRASSQGVLNPLYGQWESFGQDIYIGANSDNTLGYYGIALGMIPPSSTITIGQIYADDTRLTLDGDGNVIAGEDPNGNAIDRYNGRLRIIVYPAGGRSTFLENAALAANPTMPDWNSTFVADRVIYAAVQLDRDTEAGLFQLPEIRFTGTNSRNNPADAVLDMLTDDRFGLGKSIDTIGDSFAEHRAYCAEQVQHETTTGAPVMANRFTVDGSISATRNILERCNAILAHQNAGIGYNNGRYEIYANKELPTTGLVTMDEDWFVEGFEFAENTASAYTQLRVRFGRNSLNDFQPNVFYRDVPTTLQYPAQQPRIDTVEYPYCNDMVQAQRVSAWVTNEVYTGLTIRTVLDIRGIQLQPQQLVLITSDKYSFVSKLFQVKEIEEQQRGSVLTYRVLFREYEPSNYGDDGTIQEQDPAPNINVVDPGQINAVNDLAIVNVNQGADTPNFTLQWTVPESLIDEFDVFFSTLNLFSGAVRLRTVTSPAGVFTPGDTVQEVITGIPGGDYSFWVVGRNQTGRSAESNRVFLSWTPVTIPDNRAEGIRHHDNPVTMDPMAPSGRDGTDVGWYDPTVGTTITTNVPTDPDPHWEARGFGILSGGMQEMTDFAVTGTAGVTTTVITPSQQQVQFDLSGTIGDRELTLPARPEITEFTFTGQAAEAVGNPEYWALDFTGSSDAADSTTAMEEFFIYLTGNSSNAVSVNFGNFSCVNSFDPDLITGANGNFIWLSGTDQNSGATRNPSNVNGLSLTTTPADAQLLATALGFTLTTTNHTNLNFNDFETFTTTTAEDMTFTFTGNEAVTQTLPTGTTHYQYMFNGNFVFYFFGITFQGTVRNSAFTNQVLAEAVLGEAVASSVQISIPTEGINETFTLTNGLATATTLRDDLLGMIQTNTNITDEFTVMSAVADARTTGVTVGEPIITLLANDNTDHTIGVTFNDGTGGDLSSSAFGSHVEGNPPEVSTEIRVTYDPDLTPSFQDIVIGGANDSAAIATTVTSMINAGHNEVIATQGTFDIERNVTAVDFDAGATFDFPAIDRLSLTDASIRVPSDISLVTRMGVMLSADSSMQVRDAVFRRTGLIIVRNVDNFFIFRITGTSYISGSIQGSFTIEYESTFGPGTDSFVNVPELEDVVSGARETLTEFDIVPIVTEDTTSSRVVVQTVADGAFDEPVLTIRERGTSTSFTQAVSTLLDGVLTVDGMRTRYVVTLAGTQVAAGNFVSGATTDVASEQLDRVINNLITHTATRSNNVVTATSSTNSADDLAITITPGTNDTGSTSTNNLAVSRVVSQQGSAVDVFTGQDAMIAARVGTTVLTTVNGAGMTLEQIATAIRAAYITDTRYNATGTGTTILLTAQFTGTENSPALDVTPGILPDGTNATLAAAETILNTGQDIMVTGETTQLTVTVGALSMTVDLASGASAVDAANSLIGLINVFQLYSAMINTGSTVRATSIRAEVTEDITVTVSRVGTGGTIQVARMQIQDGVDPSVDFSFTNWTYYTINQEVRVDDDTTEMMPDNTITIPRGLVVDSENITASATTGTATAAETYLTGSARSNLVITGGVSEIVALTSTGTATHTHTMEYSIDGGMTWIEFFVTQAFNPNFGATFAGQAFNNVQFIGAQINDIPAGSTVAFRGRDTGTAATGAWGFGILIIEERNAVMT